LPSIPPTRPGGPRSHQSDPYVWRESDNGRLSAAGCATAVQPALLVSAEQLPDLTRYSITLNNQTQGTLDDLQVSVELPDDAVFDHALETPGFTQFQAQQGRRLTWTTASFAPNDIIDAFTFFLAQPSGGAFGVDATWGGESAGEIQSQVQPAVQSASEGEADLTIDASTLAQGPLPVGATGVSIVA
jgi:hypothetical protein